MMVLMIYSIFAFMCMIFLPIYMYKTKKIDPPDTNDTANLMLTAGLFVVVGLVWPVSILFVLVSEMIRSSVESIKNKENENDNKH